MTDDANYDIRIQALSGVVSRLLRRVQELEDKELGMKSTSFEFTTPGLRYVHEFETDRIWDVKALRTRIDALKGERDRLEKDCDQFRRSAQSYEYAFREAERNLAALKKERDRLSIALGNANRKARDYSKLADSVRDERDEFQRLAKHFEDQVVELKKTRYYPPGTEASLNKKIRELKANLDNKQGVINDLKRALRDIASDVDQLDLD